MSALAATTSTRACAACVCCARWHQHAGDTRFEIGQVWDLGYRASHHARPPHVEDVHVDPHGARHVETIGSLGTLLRETGQRVGQGVPFEGTLLRTDSGTGYVPIDGTVPIL